ncbi:MAG: hypothetical protein IPJ77_16765 [Planctomycetes bacterium]|nr:hypothetical protein [Planctomycetota bacterium]
MLTTSALRNALSLSPFFLLSLAARAGEWTPFTPTAVTQSWRLEDLLVQVRHRRRAA